MTTATRRPRALCRVLATLWLAFLALAVLALFAGAYWVAGWWGVVGLPWLVVWGIVIIDCEAPGRPTAFSAVWFFGHLAIGIPFGLWGYAQTQEGRDALVALWIGLDGLLIVGLVLAVLADLTRRAVRALWGREG